MKFLLSLILSFLLSLMSISHAKSHKQQKIIISDAWSRASPGKTGVVYLTIFNHDTTLDRLLSATTSIANKPNQAIHLYFLIQLDISVAAVAINIIDKVNPKTNK